MELYKIIAVGLISALLIVYLKSVNSELTVLLTIASGVIILIMTISYISEFIVFFKEFSEISEIDTTMFKIVLKIIAISYLVQFSSDLIDDFGLKSISDKVVFAGKILILVMSAPIIKSLFGIVKELI